MKLVDILASELKAWPVEHGVEFVTQDNTGHVYGWKGCRPICVHGEWIWNDAVSDFTPWRPGSIAMSEDRKVAIVTRGQWEAAVGALKVGDESSQSIDWGKAPEDATHFSPAYEGYIDLWAKTDGNRWMYRSMDASKWHYGPPPEQDEYYLERPVESMSLYHQEVGRITRVWNGEGLPPIGIKVDVLLAGNGSYLPLTPQEWQPMTMKYKSVDFCVFEREDGQEFPMWNPQYSRFRPIRTAEQISEEKRHSEIIEMVDLIVSKSEVITRAQAAIVCARLHNAGYCKQAAQ